METTWQSGEGGMTERGWVGVGNLMLQSRTVDHREILTISEVINGAVV